MIKALLPGIWCMERSKLQQLVNEITESNFADAAGFLASPGLSVSASIESSGGIAKIPIHGVIMKRVPSAFAFLGIEATSTEDTERAIRTAMANPDIKGIELSIDSPGGTIQGVQQLANMINAEKEHKPINAKVSDMAASAAYWIASQATSIEANSAALVGSIGVYRVLVDSSEAAAMNGLKINMLSSGDHKGVGTPGVKITDDQLEDEQRIVDGAAMMFKQSIAKGRDLKMKEVEKMATGQTWFAEDAKRMGLIDKITEANTSRKQEAVGSDRQEGEKVENKPQTDTKVSLEPDTRVEDLQLQVVTLQDQLSATIAEAKTKDLALVSMVEAQKQNIIDEGVKAGRIIPAMRPKVEDYATFCGADLERLKAFVGALPIQTRTQTESEEPGVVLRETITDSDRAVAKLFDLDVTEFKDKSNWSAISAGGELLDINGKIIGGLN